MQTVLRNPMHNRVRVAKQIGASLCVCFVGTYASANGVHDHYGQTGSGTSITATVSASPPVFMASTAKPFAALMDDAMAVMDDGMKRAPMNGQTEHDFITMMMPHHQGAVNMAKAVLLYTKDPEIRNLALGIITEQQNEIRVMQAWLDHHQKRPRQ